MDDMMQRLAKQMEQQLFAAIAGPPQNRRQTALRARGNGFETVELDEAGNVIEPPPRCWKCGPVLLCSEHFVCT